MRASEPRAPKERDAREDMEALKLAPGVWAITKRDRKGRLWFTFKTDHPGRYDVAVVVVEHVASREPTEIHVGVTAAHTNGRRAQ